MAQADPGEAHLELLGPIAALINESPKDTATKVAVLVDVAAALLARDGAMRSPRALRLTADAMRERLVTVTKATHEWIDQRVTAPPLIGQA